MKKRLLLISNSICFGQGYLDHCGKEIVAFLGDIKTVVFLPYASKDLDEYEKIAKERFAKMGITLTSIHTLHNQQEAIANAESIFVGGGNTFRLLHNLYEKSLIHPLKEKISQGVPYIGTSAGSNIACLTIKTTNDMPIVYPPSFDALQAVPLQINPHYIDADAQSKHMGETREKRIEEFHEENDTPVIGLREGSWLRIEGNTMKLGGTMQARLFQKNKKPMEYSTGDNMSFLLT